MAEGLPADHSKKPQMSIEEHLPQINLLLEALETGAEDNSELLYHELDQALHFLYAGYAEEIQFLAPHEAQSETAELIGKGFVEIFGLLRPLGEEVAAGDFSLAQETADTLKEAMESLYPLFRSYRQQYEEAPRYSEVPYTHELVRVCRHFLEGHLSRETVLIRLEQFFQYHEHLESQLESSEPSGAEGETLRDNAEDLNEALRAQAQGMGELEAALSSDEPDSDVIEGCLELLTTSAEVLVEVYRTLQKADQEPRLVPCVKCSHPNALTSRTCRKCGAVLPGGSALSDESISTMALEEDGSAVLQATPGELQKLHQAVHHFSSTGELEPLRKARSNFSNRLERVERRFERMSKLGGKMTEEQAAVLHSARGDFSRALGMVKEGLEILVQGEENHEVMRLELGLQKLEEAHQIFEGLRELNAQQ